jgi:type VI secretion system lysozyme-like protein
MADPRTLLQRLHDHPRGPRPGVDEETALAASVLANLDQLLGTARGTCMIDPDYGFPTLSEFAHVMPKRPCDDPDQPLLQEMRRALVRLIERREPRLSVTSDSVTLIADRANPHMLGFEIRGTLRSEHGRGPEVQCQASVSRAGSWRVSEDL